MNSRAIKEVIQNGQRHHTPYLKIFTLVHNDNEKPLQLACVVSKKVHASAVKRHKYQRWMREAARGLARSFPHNIDMVWIAKPEIVTVKKLSDLQQSLQLFVDKITD